MLQSPGKGLPRFTEAALLRVTLAGYPAALPEKAAWDAGKSRIPASAIAEAAAASVKRGSRAAAPLRVAAASLLHGQQTGCGKSHTPASAVAEAVAASVKRGSMAAAPLRVAAASLLHEQQTGCGKIPHPGKMIFDPTKIS